MSEDVDARANDESGIDQKEDLETSYKHIYALEDGSFREQGEGVQFSEVFWENAKRVTCHQQHPRVATLKTELELLYKFDGARLYVRTLRYKMTTRNGNWYRGNIDVFLKSGDSMRENSPDSMQQDNQWHDYVRYLDVPIDLVSIPYVIIRVDYDGTNNDVEPNEGWGQVLPLARRPIIDSPISNTEVETGKPFTVIGGHHLYQGTIRIYYLRSTAWVQIESGIKYNYDGSWNTTITLPPGITTIAADQTYGGTTESVKSNNVTVKLFLSPPEIDTPSHNQPIVDDRPLISGRGRNGSIVRVWQINPPRTLITGVEVKNGSWSQHSEVALGGGSITIRANAKLDELTSRETDDRTFVRPLISIGVPTDNDVTDMRTTISGSTNVPLGIVEVFREFDFSFKIGEGVVESTRWNITTFNRDMVPGPFTIVARQTSSGITLGQSKHTSFNVRPPKVELLDAVVTNGTVTITGTGYIGARLEIWYTQGDVVKTFDVTETLWTKTYPDWLPGSYSIDAKQKVLGLSNAWIDSEWNTKPVIFDVKVPPPTLTHQVGIDQKPKFSGTGNGWAGHAPAKVELQITSSSNSILPSMPIVDVKNNSWSNDALEQWDPGTYSVEARQLFTPTGKPQLSSDWTGPQQVVIKAPLPAIDPIVENGLSPDITGTCWKGAVVTLFFSDAITTAYPVPDSDRDGRWTFRRPALFKPGSHTVKATQTFGGQTSNEVTKPFTVDVPTPVIKPMTPPVGYEPIITGTGGYAGAEMTIYDYANNRPLGKAMVIGEAWTVPLLELEFREYQIYAVQSFDKLPSGRSELISFKAVLLPPTVDTPKPGDTVARTFRIEGHGSRASGSEVAQVWVWRGEEPEPWDRIRVKYDGTWYYHATLPLGTETLRFKQFFKGQASEFTLDHVLGVVPAHPVIETPARGEAIESRVAISGFGYGGDTVSVAFADALDVILGTTQVLENGTWSLWLLLDRPAGHPSLVAQQSFGDYLSGWTTPRPVELRPQPPQFTAPLPGRWVKSQPTFAGTAMPGAEIRLQAWFNPDIDLITSPAVGEDWEATPPNELPRSEHWVCAVQSVKEGGEQVSATADSARFEIMPAQGRGADLNP